MQYLPRLIHDIHEKKFHFGLPKKNAVLRKYDAEKNLVQKKGISVIDCVSSIVWNRSLQFDFNHDFSHTFQPALIKLLFELFDAKLFLCFNIVFVVVAVTEYLTHRAWSCFVHLTSSSAKLRLQWVMYHARINLECYSLVFIQDLPSRNPIKSLKLFSCKKDEKEIERELNLHWRLMVSTKRKIKLLLSKKSNF